ncbi:MAG: HlyD family secretion protein [Vampirovibrionia bacterium]
MKFKPLFVIAIVGMILGVSFVIIQAKEDPKIQPIRQPAVKPYKNSIAGLGIVEAYRENIEVAPYWAGKVTDVLVSEGQTVKAGDVLYTLDTNDLQARQKSATLQATAKQSFIDRLTHEPRKENIPPLEALVKQTEANYNNIKAQYDKIKAVTDPRAVSLDAIDSKKYELEAAKANMEKAKADLEKLKAGAWSYDIDQAKSEKEALLATADEYGVLIKQATIRAPKSGEILKVNTRKGQFASTVSATPPVLMGTTEQLQVRVDIDEINAPSVKSGMKAMASLKGDAKKSFPLTFVRVQPYMVPKTNLSGKATERVDVRVLQVIYSFEPQKFPVYVGQQVDVYLDNDKK